MSSAIQQLLVHLDSTERSRARLGIARQLSQQHGCALAALYAATPSVMTMSYAGSAGLAVQLLALDDDRRKRALANFQASMEKPGAVATWSEVTDLSAIGTFARQALYADLLVLGQHDSAAEVVQDVPPDFVESVLAITEEGVSDVPDKGLSLSTYLRAHRIEPTWHRDGQEPSRMGEVLLSAAADLGADLLVMGCYGHSRAREWALGGMSRSVLRSMTMPVPMVH